MSRYLLGEYVSEKTALMRHSDEWAPILRRFFADAGNNVVRTFRDRDLGLSGYAYIVALPDGKYRWIDVVTGIDVQVIAPRLDGETRARIERQFKRYEWNSMAISGPEGIIPAIEIGETEEPQG